MLWYFLNAMKAGLTCRIVTTSVKEEHLDVLWGEIGRFLSTSRHPLIWHPNRAPDAPLAVNYHEIRRRGEMDAKNPLNYLKGMVAKDREGMQGHHAEMTLLVGDEASALDDAYHEAAQGWAKRFLYFSNPEQCENFFKKAVKAGDLA